MSITRDAPGLLGGIFALIWDCQIGIERDREWALDRFEKRQQRQ